MSFPEFLALAAASAAFGSGIGWQLARIITKRRKEAAR